MLGRVFLSGSKSIIKAATLESYRFGYESFKRDPSIFYKNIRRELDYINSKQEISFSKQELLKQIYQSIENAEILYLEKKVVSRQFLITNLSSIFANIRDLEIQDTQDVLASVEKLRNEVIGSKPVSVSIKIDKRTYSTSSQQKSDELVSSIKESENMVTTSMIEKIGGLYFLSNLTDMAKANGANFASITILRSLKKDVYDFSILLDAKTSVKISDFTSVIDEILKKQYANEKSGYLSGELYKDFSKTVRDAKLMIESDEKQSTRW